MYFFPYFPSIVLCPIIFFTIKTNERELHLLQKFCPKVVVCRVIRLLVVVVEGHELVEERSTQQRAEDGLFAVGDVRCECLEPQVHVHRQRSLKLLGTLMFCVL